MKQKETIVRSITTVALLTLLILMIPLIAMLFTSEMNWDITDFIIVGALVFVTGISYKLITRSVANNVFRIASAFALGTTLLMIWANLGVGLIGSGPNPGNIIYMLVPVVVIVGTFLSNFRPAGMERAMYATVLTLVLVTLIALITGMDDYPGSSVTEILSVSGFFLMLFIVSALIFRYAARHSHDAPDKSSA